MKLLPYLLIILSLFISGCDSKESTAQKDETASSLATESEGTTLPAPVIDRSSDAEEQKSLMDQAKDVGQNAWDKSKKVTEEAFEKSKEYGASAMEKSKELYESAREEGAELGDSLGEKSKELWGATKEKSKEYYEDAKKKGKELYDRATEGSDDKDQAAPVREI